jgi:hypothetical protein
MLRVVVVAPPEFLAVTMKVAAAATVVGVPEITPVVAFNVNPGGRAGDTE